MIVTRRPRRLSDDVERWLADEPVNAYPDPWVSRIGRLLRKNRAASLATAATIATALLALLLINSITRAKNHEIANKADVIDQQNAELRSANEQLTASQKQANNNYEAARDLAFTLVNKGEDELSKQKGMESLRQWLTTQALQTFKDLHEQSDGDPELKTELAILYRYSANLDRFFGRLDDAFEKFDVATGLLDEAMVLEPEQPDRIDMAAEMLRDQATVFRETGKLGQARARLVKAGQLVTQLRSADPDNLSFRRTGGINAMELALVLRDLANQKEALLQADLSAQLLRELADSEGSAPVDPLLVLLAWDAKADILLEFGKAEAARDILTEADRFAEQRLADNDSIGATSVHAVILLGWARALEQQQQPAREIMDLLESCTSKLDGVMEISASPRYREKRALARTLQAKQAIRSGDNALAEEFMEQANDDRQALNVDESPSVSRLKSLAEYRPGRFRRVSGTRPAGIGQEPIGPRRPQSAACHPGQPGKRSHKKKIGSHQIVFLELSV